MKIKKHSTRESIDGYLFILPWLIGFLGLNLIPMVATLYLGFTDFDMLSSPEFTGLANFIRMFTDDVRYWASVKATLYFAFVSVPVRLVFALFVAMMLHNNRRGTHFYRALYYAPSVVGSSVAVAVMWREIFGPNGLFNAILAKVHLPADTVWLGDPRFAIWTLILLVVWQFGSPMLIFLAGLKQIPTDLYESSSIDGAGPVRQFFKITLPMLTPIFLFNLVMQMITGFTAFTQSFIVTNGKGTPLDTTNFYALYLYSRAFESFQMGYGSAMAIVLLIAVALFTGLIFKSSPMWVHYESE
ncbi:MAG: sugar ABC transporter permease [Spirochaetales bacterium]|nr:sugar ABC transporter permease [Spirochaetales bacterium]